jgi:hypothetical protein
LIPQRKILCARRPEFKQNSICKCSYLIESGEPVLDVRQRIWTGTVAGGAS